MNAPQEGQDDVADRINPHRPTTRRLLASFRPRCCASAGARARAVVVVRQAGDGNGYDVPGAYKELGRRCVPALPQLIKAGYLQTRGGIIGRIRGRR